MLYFLYCWLPVLIYLTTIFYLSSQSHPQLPAKYPDYILHGVEYFLLTLLLLRGFLLYGIPESLRTQNLLSLLVATLYGVSDEIHQFFVPYRVFSFYDLLANFVGAILAISAYQMSLFLRTLSLRIKISSKL